MIGGRERQAQDVPLELLELEISELAAHNGALGLDIGPGTCASRWMGDRLDLSPAEPA